jgi:virginiamycin B lyase
MLRRLISIVALAAFAAGASGCSNSASGDAVPGVSNTALNASPFVRFAKEPIKFRLFSDLPEYHGYYFPAALCLGPDDALWVTDNIDQDIGESAVARITASGKRTKTFYYPNSASPAFLDIATGSDGSLWIVDSADGAILRLTTSGQFTTFPVTGFGPASIAAGKDGALWFTENSYKIGGIGRITTGGTITNYTAGISAGAVVADIAPGSDGALWFTEATGDRIGRITASGAITEFSKGITPGSEPNSIAAGPDGALWFTETAGGRIGRITTHGKVSEYSAGITSMEEPGDLAAGSDGAIWFTEYEPYASYSSRAAKIGRITTQGKITEYSGIGSHSKPTGIVQGPDRNMWFIETAADRLGRVEL